MRKLILMLVLTYSIVWMLPQVSIAKIDPETAVGVWLFDEGVGNDTKDASGNDHDGEINGAKKAIKCHHLSSLEVAGNREPQQVSRMKIRGFTSQRPTTAMPKTSISLCT